MPTTVAARIRPSEVVTVMVGLDTSPSSVATCALVRMCPCLSSTMPDPEPAAPGPVTSIVTTDGTVFAAIAVASETDSGLFTVTVLGPVAVLEVDDVPFRAPYPTAPPTPARPPTSAAAMMIAATLPPPTPDLVLCSAGTAGADATPKAAPVCSGVPYPPLGGIGWVGAVADASAGAGTAVAARGGRERRGHGVSGVGVRRLLAHLSAPSNLAPSA